MQSFFTDLQPWQIPFWVICFGMLALAALTIANMILDYYLLKLKRRFMNDLKTILEKNSIEYVKFKDQLKFNCKGGPLYIDRVYKFKGTYFVNITGGFDDWNVPLDKLAERHPEAPKRLLYFFTNEIKKEKALP